MKRAILGGVAIIALAAAFSSPFIVQQTEQVLVTQFGEPRRVITEPGLHFKVPFVQTVISFDRRLLDFDAPGEEVILGDQRRLIVDSFTRFRITDPLLFFQTAGAVEAGIRGRLSSIVVSAMRRVLGNEPLLAVLSSDRARIMGEIRRQVNEEALRFGVAVEDVRIRRADLPEENTQAILQRMQSERERVAREARAEGAEVAARIRAGAERERTVILAESEAQSNTLRGQGEEEAIRLFADAFQRDPEFYGFYRAMQAYRETFSDGETRLILTPDSEFFRYFRQSQPGQRVPGVVPVPEAPVAPAGLANGAAQPAAPQGGMGQGGMGQGGVGQGGATQAPAAPDASPAPAPATP
ncbi:protease modulator HflC [Teichococcus cervicalis]|uniref:Protein HflC n=1 Tax=Pseudoroseomonas cervicalis ATCC 49957 TaxID=525371 RepID=D5RIT6_9PROT|nr:protease modulator HflC [Pseudoroseomonas cervicalis]EFH12758.1 HflC protein [Pseudoroseomonas cervicalis ATCC 49957]